VAKSVITGFPRRNSDEARNERSGGQREKH
jgi:hypothetical protein